MSRLLRINYNLSTGVRPFASILIEMCVTSLNNDKVPGKYSIRLYVLNNNCSCYLNIIMLGTSDKKKTKKHANVATSSIFFCIYAFNKSPPYVIKQAEFTPSEQALARAFYIL